MDGHVYIYFHRIFYLLPLIQFCICTYVFTAAFCQQFIKEYDDDDDDVNGRDVIASCQSAATSEILKALLVTSLTHVSSAIEST